MGSWPYLCGFTSAGLPGRRTAWQVLIRLAIATGAAFNGISTGSPPLRSTHAAYCGQERWLYAASVLVGSGMAMRGRGCGVEFIKPQYSLPPSVSTLQSRPLEDGVGDVGVGLVPVGRQSECELRAGALEAEGSGLVHEAKGVGGRVPCAFRRGERDANALCVIGGEDQSGMGH